MYQQCACKYLDSTCLCTCVRIIRNKFSKVRNLVEMCAKEFFLSNSARMTFFKVWALVEMCVKEFFCQIRQEWHNLKCPGYRYVTLWHVDIDSYTIDYVDMSHSVTYLIFGLNKTLTAPRNCYTIDYVDTSQHNIHAIWS